VNDAHATAPAVGTDVHTRRSGEHPAPNTNWATGCGSWLHGCTARGRVSGGIVRFDGRARDRAAGQSIEPMHDLLAEIVAANPDTADDRRFGYPDRPVAERPLGRQPARQTIQRMLTEFDAGSLGCLAISGEPGIGKSWLLGEARCAAEASGIVVLAGRASEFEREIPFGPVVDALGDRVAEMSLGPDRDRVTTLAHVFPSLARSLSARSVTRPAETHAERYRLHEALRATLGELAAGRPLALVLDDLHCADEGTLGLVAHLVRHPPPAAVLLVVAYRSAQAPRMLASALATAERHGTVTSLELGPLSDVEAAELVGSDVDDRVRSALYRDAGGNPFYLQELAGAWRASPRSPAPPHAPAAHPGLPMPTPVLSAIDDEVAKLTAVARVFLHGASVAGDPFDVDLAAAIAGLAEPEALAALDEVVRADLARPGPGARRYGFRHPIVRRAVGASAEDAWRDSAHATAAATLAARGAPATHIAHHVEHVARVGDGAAISLLRQAGDEVAARAPSTAARWYATALGLLPADGDEHLRIDLLASLAQALAAAGQFEQSGVVLAEVLALMPDDAAGVRENLAVAIARADHIHGHHARAQTILADALARPLGPRSAAQLRVQLAIEHWGLFEAEQCRVCAARARWDAITAGDELVVAQAEALLALAALHCQDVSGAIAHIDRASRAIERIPSRELAARPDAAVMVALAHHAMERTKPAARQLHRTLSAARVAEHGIAMIPPLTELGRQQLWLGLLREAADTSERAIEAAMAAGVTQWLMAAMAIRAEVALARDELPVAWELGEQAAAIARRVPGSIHAAGAACTLGLILAESGDAVAGRAAVLDAAGGPDLALIGPPWRSLWYGALAEMEIGLGVPDAECWVMRAEWWAERFGMGARVALARRARAGFSLAMGDPGAAAALAQEAAVALRHADARVEAARAGLVAGDALARSGELDVAAGVLEEARAELSMCGADRYMHAADRLLRALPGRPARDRWPRDERAEGLSVRELEVAGLVAEGLSNRAVAELLCVTPKTVESHLGRIYRKLGISGRARLAYALTRPGVDAARVRHERR
jgi:predicted ATPase/DNA-binding CsgD family transcriptional regulator